MRNVVSYFVWKLQHVKKIELKKKNLSNSAQKTLKKEKESI
jgi:hypothetical protein